MKKHRTDDKTILEEGCNPPHFRIRHQPQFYGVEKNLGDMHFQLLQICPPPLPCVSFTLLMFWATMIKLPF